MVDPDLANLMSASLLLIGALVVHAFARPGPYGCG